MRNRPLTGRPESGFTLVELMITMMLLTTVMAAIFGVLESQTRTERRVQIFADNQEVLRQAIVAMQRDIRSSEPLKKLATSPEFALRIELDVYEKITDPAPIAIRWIVDTSTAELRREVVGIGTTPTAVTHRVSGVANSYAVPLFTFYNANSTAAIPTTTTSIAGSPDPGEYNLATANPADIANCAVRIRINLVAAPTPGPAPARLVSDAQLRNRLPGGTGCPGVNLTGVG